MYSQLAALPAPDLRNTVTHESGYNPDIISVVNSQFSKAVSQCENVHFSGKDATTKARAIFNFLRNRVKYKKDPEGAQFIQLPARLLHATREGDCKSLALSAAAFMYCNGLKNVRLRYASYKANDRTPSHVYAVASDERGNDILVDAVLPRFNYQVPYQFKTDYPMKISVLSGVVAPLAQQERTLKTVKRKPSPANRLQILERLKNKVRPGGLLFTVISNRLADLKQTPANVNYSREQIERYKRMLVRRLPNVATRPALRWALQNEIDAISTNRFKGVIYTAKSSQQLAGLEEEIGKLSLKKIRKGLKKIKLRDITRGVKTVALVAPRKAFLALVTLNVRGLAKRMSLLNDAELKKLWVQRFGGKLSIIKSAISKGKKKRPLLGASKKVRAIKGIGFVVDESVGVVETAAAAAATGGGNPVNVGAIIAAAAPILVAVISLLKKKGIPEDTITAAASAAQDLLPENQSFPEAEAPEQENRPGLASWIKKATDIARETGIIPDKPETVEESKVNEAIPGDDYETEPGAAPDAKISLPGLAVPLVIGAGALYFLTRKKK